MALTPKQAAFVREYLVDLNATQAAIRAGYSKRTAEKIGSENLRKPEVASAIQSAMTQRAARVQVTADEVLGELKRVALVDIGEAFHEDGRLKKLHEMPPDVRRAIAAIEVDEIGGEDNGIGVTRKVKFWSKPDALQALGRHLKLFTDKVEHEAGPGFADLVLASMKPKGGA